MVAIEKAGIPAVAIAARSFARAWQSCVDGWGQPSTAFVTIPHATTGQQADFINKMVDDQIDEIIQHLTFIPSTAGSAKSARSRGQATEVFTVEMDETPEGLDAVNRFLAERDWSDGIPVMPPTPEAVERILNGTKRAPQDVVMVMEPGFGLATVEKIAINAVMAGCRPEQFPVLLAAIDCLAKPEMNHRDMQVSGHTEAPIILVNGPIAKKAGLNVGTTAMGPGVINSANTAIGRALRLCLINIGYCNAGAGDPNFVGLPSKFGMCIAENEEDSPWGGLHVSRDFQPEDSCVTVAVAYNPITVNNAYGHTGESILASIADTLRSACLAWRFPAQWVLVIGPEHAITLKEDGWTRRGMQDYLMENASRPLSELIRLGVAQGPEKPGDDQLVRRCAREADDIWIVMGGGTGGRNSAIIDTTGYRVRTRKIEMAGG